MTGRLGKILTDCRQFNVKTLHNAVLNVAESRLQIARPRSYPVRLDIVLTKACNLRCTFCISYGSLTGARWLDFRLYEQIARELFPRAVSVNFCSGGEPFLYPQFREALQLARKYRVYVKVVSNGTLLNQDTARWVAGDQTLQEMLISFDGARKETLERIRRGASYPAILRNLEFLSGLKAGRNLAYPKLAFHYIIMKSNARELPEIFPLCARVGVEKVRVTYLNVANALEIDESLFHHQELAAQVFQEAAKRAKEWGIALELPLLPSQDAGQHRCLIPWQFCQVDTDGSIRFCYRSWRQRLGFFTSGFESIWRGPHYQKIRRTLNSSSPYFPYCLHCPNRLGVNQEASHIQAYYPEAYVINGLEAWQVPFNPREQENILSFGGRKQEAGSAAPLEDGP